MTLLPPLSPPDSAKPYSLKPGWDSIPSGKRKRMHALV